MLDLRNFSSNYSCRHIILLPYECSVLNLITDSIAFVEQLLKQLRRGEKEILCRMMILDMRN